MILALAANAEHVFVHHRWPLVSMLRVIQIVIKELNSLTPAYPAVKYGKVRIKWKGYQLPINLILLRKWTLSCM
jgi:hypothetical protein